MVRVLTDDEVEALLDLESLLDVIENGLIRQYRGDVERPERPHLLLGHGIASDDPLGMGLVMPAYVHGSPYFVTKLVGLFEGNRSRGHPTIHASIVVLDASTGKTVGLLDGTRITNARTGCVGGVAARALTEGTIRLGIIGAGQQARWQARAISTACAVQDVRIYAPSDSRFSCADQLVKEGITATAVATARDAVVGADVVVTATTSADPVFPADALEDESLVVAIGAFTAEMQEIESAVVRGAAAIFADVPEEVATIGDIREAGVDTASILPLGGLLAGDTEIPSDGLVLVESVGSAVFDAVATEHLFEQAIEQDSGSILSFH